MHESLKLTRAQECYSCVIPICFTARRGERDDGIGGAGWRCTAALVCWAIWTVEIGHKTIGLGQAHRLPKAQSHPEARRIAKRRKAAIRYNRKVCSRVALDPHEMAQQFSYSDDSPIHVGDWVRLEHGSAKGRVSEIICNTQLAAEKKLGGLGVVVDAQPKGFVFLSEACLQEDPLQLVRRGPGEQTRFHAAFALGLGALFLLPAVYSFFSALYSALSTGEVLVIAVDRYEIHRETVPWTAGWARFAGPPVLVSSLLAYDGSMWVTLRWWLAAAALALMLACVGGALWTAFGGT